MPIISLGARGTGIDWPGVRAGWGRTVRLYRKKAGMSQRELADAVGATQSFISHLEKRGSGVGDELRYMLAAVFGVEVEDLFAYPARRGRGHAHTR